MANAKMLTQTDRSECDEQSLCGKSYAYLCVECFHTWWLWPPCKMLTHADGGCCNDGIKTLSELASADESGFDGEHQE